MNFFEYKRRYYVNVIKCINMQMLVVIKYIQQIASHKILAMHQVSLTQYTIMQKQTSVIYDIKSERYMNILFT